MTLKVSGFDSYIKTPLRVEPAKITLSLSKSIKIRGTAFAMIKRKLVTPPSSVVPAAITIRSDIIRTGFAARGRAWLIENRRNRKSSRRFHDINCDFAMIQAQIDEVFLGDQGMVLFSSELHCDASNQLITMEIRGISTVSEILFRSEMTVEQRALNTGNTWISVKL